ncbi:MAG: hypothetical protein ACJA1N_000939 [Saprospiraceae bacterium]|jgi:hypothetical protein|tara:strand:+ start:363 stop:779 length:417 start_codon:yes stop_codon:yes gene_type:complete
MSETELYQNIQILIQKGSVYLYNKTSETIEELIYETTSMFTTDDVIAISSTPKYQINNILSNTAVLLEILDGWEDGKPSYYLTKVETKTIDFQGNMNLRIKNLSGFVTLPKIVTHEITKLETKEGFIINTNEKIKNDE